MWKACVVLLMSLPLQLQGVPAMDSVTVTVVFDNTALANNVTPEWGFAAVLEFPNETILFDTGNDGDILMKNLKALGFGKTSFSKIVISHMHWDHTGGLETVLKRNPEAAVFLPASATAEEVEAIKPLCREIVQVSDPQAINEVLMSLGELPGRANEQSLGVACDSGIVVVTGCAHPGIVEIVEQAHEVLPNQPVLWCVGGFHLHRHSKKQVMNIIKSLKKLEVRQVSPTHCTGEEAIEWFAKEYGDHYIRGGVGARQQFQLATPHENSDQ